MMERFGRGVVMSWREKNIKTEEQGGRGREVEKRGSGVLVLVFVCGKISLGVISVMLNKIDTDTVADLRPILAALKNLTRISASHPNIKTIFNNLTTRKTQLSEEDRENYKDLATIEDFLAQRTNLYDTVHNPEADIKTQAPPTSAQHYEPLTLPDRTNTATMGENIPLISAGTFTGLQSENPQDYLFAIICDTPSAYSHLEI
ncbi:hypothetical protein J6590_090071 [Homalodisca vitripennis]|nr:hypothetical protein J6590_090071 [Homalodisca vitripennis]